jgi:hypothetical protein
MISCTYVSSTSIVVTDLMLVVYRNQGPRCTGVLALHKPRNYSWIMSGAESEADPLAGWDPRRRQALERLWASFSAAGGQGAHLGDELIQESRAEARPEDSRAPAR